MMLSWIVILTVSAVLIATVYCLRQEISVLAVFQDKFFTPVMQLYLKDRF